jgi:hypothetical protein
MKFELNRPTDYSEDALLKEIRRVAILIENKPLTKPKFDKNSKYSASTIERRFNGWLNALRKAGLDDSYLHTENLKITNEEIVSELKRVATFLKTNSFTRLEFANNSHLNKNVFFHKDNTFNSFMKLAGLDPPKLSKRFSDQDCFENLLKVWTHYGRQPHFREMKTLPSVVGPNAYIYRWGSWTKALLAFLEKANSDIKETESTIDSVDVNILPKETKKVMQPENRREIPLGLRFNILQRDRYKCVICGRSPATKLSIELHVDHILPFSKGGQTRDDNLRTLCNECNIGKSDKLDQ